MLGLNGIAQRFFGSSNERKLRPFYRRVESINALEPSFEAKSNEELRALTPAFKERLIAGESLEDILPEAFAAVREAAKRTLGQRHFDVQLMGGMVLHQGQIAAMKTGEGKTLVATLPAYLNALGGQGVYLVTVNDYLAKRDCGWNGRIFDLLGLTTAAIVGADASGNTVSCLFDPTYTDERASDERLAHLRPIDRYTAYAADITYGT